jgi:hypothetical protein
MGRSVIDNRLDEDEWYHVGSLDGDKNKKDKQLKTVNNMSKSSAKQRATQLIEWIKTMKISPKIRKQKRG